MGYCCTDRCYNTPHAWQLGWISPALVDADALLPGQPKNMTLYTQSVFTKSGAVFVRVAGGGWARGRAGGRAEGCPQGRHGKAPALRAHSHTRPCRPGP